MTLKVDLKNMILMSLKVKNNVLVFMNDNPAERLVITYKYFAKHICFGKMYALIN